MLIIIVAFLIILSIVVFVHEIGHFYTAIKLGIGVEEFGFGFPPRIFGIKKKGILYSVNWIPLGGFVKIKGESGENEQDEDSFNNQAIWKRAVVLFAGVFMNWVFAFVLITWGFMIGIPAIIGGDDIQNANIENKNIQIVQAYPGSVAEEAGLKMGDFIQKVDGREFVSANDLESYLAENIDQEFDFEIKRAKENLNLNLKAKNIPELDKKLIGISMVDSAIISYKWYRAPWEAIKTTFNVTIAIFMALFGIVAGLIKGQGAGDVSGPVGVAVFSGRAFEMGFAYVLQFMALISINLAVINILPFPALDGGRILFLIIEKIRRKPNNQKIEAMVHNTGFILLMALIVLITYKDIVKYIFN